MDLNVQISEEIEQYEKKIYDQKQLIHISKALNSNLNLNNLIESILNISLAQSQTFQIGIYLNPEVANHDFFLHENFIGFETRDDLDYVIPYRSPFISFLANTKKLYMLNELKEMKEINTKELKQEVARRNRLTDQPKTVDIIAAIPDSYKKQLLPCIKVTFCD